MERGKSILASPEAEDSKTICVYAFYSFPAPGPSRWSYFGFDPLGFYLLSLVLS